jgi:hypothetical protein
LKEYSLTVRPGFFKHGETIAVDDLADAVARALAYKKVL